MGDHPLVVNDSPQQSLRLVKDYRLPRYKINTKQEQA